MLQLVEHKLQHRERAGNRRSLCVDPVAVDFASNDYLGLARSSDLMQDIMREWESESRTTDVIVGSTGSRLLTGNSSYCVELERFLALHYRADMSLLYATGFMANLGLLPALSGPQDTILFDTGVHASTRDAIRQCAARSFPWRHHDVEHLTRRLSQASGTIFVCVESVYSTDGSVGPLEAIVDVCERFGAILIVDEAHTTGVLGTHGEGMVVARGLESRVPIRVHTFGKALGVQGAVIVGSERLRDALINYSRPFIYTTAMPLYALAAIKCAHRKVRDMSAARRHVQALSDYFDDCASACILGYKGSASPIKIVTLGNVTAARAAARRICRAGFDVRVLLSPTVRRGEECLRICIHSYNNMDEIKGLIEVITCVAS